MTSQIGCCYSTIWPTTAHLIFLFKRAKVIVLHTQKRYNRPIINDTKGDTCMVIVRTKDELARVKKKKVKEFKVVGDLADKVVKAQKITKLSKQLTH